MGIFDAIANFFSGSGKSASAVDNTVSSGGKTTTDSEKGRRATQENQTKAAYAYLTVDYALRATIQDIRLMDRSDGRVKRVHNRVARDVTRGGLVMQHDDPNSKIAKEWDAFRLRLNLHKAEKLKSDARGLVIEGNLPYQWVVDPTLRAVVAGVRMPTESIRPNVGVNGRFTDMSKAYTQMDLSTGNELCHFGLWQMTLARLDPDNYDDMLCMGRPFVDASRDHNAKWRAFLADAMEPLGNHGVRVVPSACNFLLLIFEGDVTAEDAYKGLMERGYITRWLPGQGLAQGLRVTIGTEDETRGVAAALRDIVTGN